MDHRLPVPGQVRRALTPSRRCENIRGHGARGLAGAKNGALFRLADDDVGGGQVQQDTRTGERLARRGRQRRPEVLADLDGEGELRAIFGVEDQGRGELNSSAVQAHVPVAGVASRRKPALLVVLTVVGEIGLRHDRDRLAVSQHHRAVVEGVAIAKRRPHDSDHARRVRRLGHDRDLPLHLVQQRRLHQQVVDRIAASATAPGRRSGRRPARPPDGSGRGVPRRWRPGRRCAPPGSRRRRGRSRGWRASGRRTFRPRRDPSGLLLI